MSGKRIVETVRSEIEAAKGTRIWIDYVHALQLISQVVFTRSSGFVLEFLQNAEDAGLELDTRGEFDVSISPARIKISHNGRPFDEANLRALCGIGSSKKPEKGTLGYLGIGFKSVFKVTDAPEVYSGDLQFKFDRNHHEWGDPSQTPWHIAPLWLDTPSEPVDPDRTTFIVPFRDTSIHTSLTEDLAKLNTELYLFLRWIKRISVLDERSGNMWSAENLGDDQDGITTLSHNGKKQRFRFFRKTVTQIPDWVREDRLTQEYRRNVTQREITVGFQLDDAGSLFPGSAGAMYGGVYSFLPLGEARSGVKFPIQADFLVQPGRDAINYEAKWNHWLLGEVEDLCRTAILAFAEHDKWRYEFLPVFDFVKIPGLESHEKLFGPRLIQPLEEFLDTQPCIPTVNGHSARVKEVIRLDEEPEAVDDLANSGVLAAEETAAVLGGDSNLYLVDRRVCDGNSIKIHRVDRRNLLSNDDFLKRKASVPDGPRWFRRLYLWLHRYPVYDTYSERKRHHREVRRYDDFEFVLSADAKLRAGKEVSILQITDDAGEFITDLAGKLLEQKPIVHQEVLDQQGQTDSVRGFLTGLAGVQVLDAKAVCRERVLPEIVASQPPPNYLNLIRYTRYCKRFLGADLGTAEIWIAAKSGRIRAAREVLLPREFKPAQDWETNQAYVTGLEFADPSYLENQEDDNLSAWRTFFRAGQVKDAPDNGIEDFAMRYTLEHLRSRWRRLVRVDARNFGYDLEGEDEHGQRVQIEVKGCAKERDIELTPNETTAADKYRASFYLCVVSGIPEQPMLCVVQNPADLGKKDRITIPTGIWKEHRWNP